MFILTVKHFNRLHISRPLAKQWFWFCWYLWKLQYDETFYHFRYTFCR